MILRHALDKLERVYPQVSIVGHQVSNAVYPSISTHSLKVYFSVLLLNKKTDNDSFKMLEVVRTQ